MVASRGGSYTRPFWSLPFPHCTIRLVRMADGIFGKETFNSLSRSIGVASLSLKDMVEAMEQLGSLAVETEDFTITFSETFIEKADVVGWLDETFVPIWKMVGDSFLSRLGVKGWPGSGFPYCFGLNETPLNRNRSLYELVVAVDIGMASSSASKRYPSIGWRFNYGQTVGTEYLHSLGEGEYIRTRVLSMNEKDVLEV